jgi:hypothetical protein
MQELLPLALNITAEQQNSPALLGGTEQVKTMALPKWADEHDPLDGSSHGGCSKDTDTSALDAEQLASRLTLRAITLQALAETERDGLKALHLQQQAIHLLDKAEQILLEVLNQ